MTTSHQPSNAEIEQLAADIGTEVYIDVAKWHLYLNDAKLHTQLTEMLAPMIVEQRIDEASVTSVLQQISVKIGGGRRELPLADLLPMQSLINLLDLLEDYGRKWS